MASWNLKAHQDLIDSYEARRQNLLKERNALSAETLPLKFLRQQAHFTTPASDLNMVTKAVESGSAATAKILQKFGITTAELAARLGVSAKAVEEELAREVQSPLVMIDGEDAQALRDDVVERGRENAVKAFRDAKWGRTLRFYRPSGLGLDYCIQDLVIVLTQAAEGKSPADFPIDGIIWPKAEHPDQLRMVSDLLSDLERRLDLPPNRIKMQFLVESGWAVGQLAELVKPVIPRLAGIIFGIADYSADIGLPHIVNDHPVCDYARAAIVNIAGTIGVPAIDNMTVNYPVADASLSQEENKELILSRLKEAFDDARHGQALGMNGKWVGHPAQLFTVRLAYRTSLDEQEILAEVRKIEAYNVAVADEKGATIIEGVMSDRATDRHARDKLRKAIAWGLLDIDTGLRLGLISDQEARELRETH